MVEKFIKDYADVKKNEIKVNPYIKEEIKERAIEKIDVGIFLKEKGYLTRDEAILVILNCFEYLNE